jgi:hypothetical protein
MKIALWPRFARAPLLDHLGREADFHCQLVDDADSLRAALDGAQALVMPGSSYDATVARVLREQAGTLRFIQLLTAGYEGLLEHGVPPGVRVANAGDSCRTNSAHKAQSGHGFTCSPRVGWRSYRSHLLAKLSDHVLVTSHAVISL